MKRNSSEAKGAKEEGNTLGLVNGAGEDNRRLTDKLIEQVYQVDIFVFMRAKEEVLLEGRDSLIFAGRDGYSERVGKGGALE